MSAAARQRIALAQKKRWAAFNAAKGGTSAKATKAAKPAPKPAKRALSAEGRARIIAATKKRWAAFRKAQQAPKPAAKKSAKPVAKKPPEATTTAAPVVAATPAAQ